MPDDTFDRKPRLTRIHRKQRFYTCLAVRDMVSGKMYIYRTLSWTMELNIRVDPTQPLGESGCARIPPHTHARIPPRTHMHPRTPTGLHAYLHTRTHTCAHARILVHMHTRVLTHAHPHCAVSWTMELNIRVDPTHPLSE